MNRLKLKGSIEMPGDKSISHRALIFAAFCKGISNISNLSPAQDCLSTIDCLRKLGLLISDDDQVVRVEANGINALLAPREPLFAGNSGTTIRLMSGFMAGRPMMAQFDGDASLRQRPMARVLDHLKIMGAEIQYHNGQGLAPFTMIGGNLTGGEFVLPLPSAQIQTALLLAGLQARGTTTVRLPGPVRDHTERMFAYIGIPFKKLDERTVSVEALSKTVKPFEYNVMGDISSAAFFIVAAACLPGSSLTLVNIGMNPGRTLIIDVLTKMGAHIELIDKREAYGELVADVKIEGNGRLKGINISGSDIARGVDEIPILALAGSLCEGEFSVSDAQELRHKESDRLQLITSNLKAAGAQVVESEDGFVITGKNSLPGGSSWQTSLDHRLAMTGVIANLLCDNPLSIEETDSTAVSYPGFVADVNSLIANN